MLIMFVQFLKMQFFIDVWTKLQNIVQTMPITMDIAHPLSQQQHGRVDEESRMVQWIRLNQLQFFFQGVVPIWGLKPAVVLSCDLWSCVTVTITPAAMQHTTTVTAGESWEGKQERRRRKPNLSGLLTAAAIAAGSAEILWTVVLPMHLSFGLKSSWDF